MSSGIPHDRGDQLRFIQNALLEGEQLHGVFDCKGAETGFVGLTDRRVILEDRSYVGNKIALTSIPYSRIASVAILTNQSIFGDFFSSGELLITTVGGTHHTAEFRGVDKTKFTHDFILWRLGA
jgi:hypothetical protein